MKHAAAACCWRRSRVTGPPPWATGSSPCKSRSAGAGISRASCGGSTRSRDRKSTRLNSSHSQISYAVFCLKKKHVSHVEPSRHQVQHCFQPHLLTARYYDDLGPLRLEAEKEPHSPLVLVQRYCRMLLTRLS